MLTKSSRYTYGVFFALLLIFGCSDPSGNLDSKDNSVKDISKESPLVDDAQKAYEELILQNAPALRTESDERKKRTADKKVFWKTVQKLQIDGAERLVIPFNLKEEYFAELPDKSKISYSNASYLIATKTNSGYTFEVMTKIPDISYLQAPKYQGYSGQLIFENLLGEFIRGYQVTRDGKATAIVRSTNVSNARTATEQCTYVDWYSCSGGNCQYMHTDVTCSGSNAPTFSFGTGEGYGSIGEDVSGGVGPTPTPGGEPSAGLPFVGKLCPPVNWTVTGTAKSANVSGLGLTAINYSTDQIINVEIGVSCVTIKTYGRSNEALGTMFAYAYNNARQKVDTQIQNGTILYQHNVIRARLISYIQEQLRNFDTSAVFLSGQECLSTANNVGNYFCAIPLKRNGLFVTDLFLS